MELKRNQAVPTLPRWVNPFNRTSVELKHTEPSRTSLIFTTGTFNRTSVELKPSLGVPILLLQVTFNRTSVELKQFGCGIISDFSYLLLIEPAWN